MLPGESGNDILDKLRKTQQYKTLPVIMLTAKTSEYDIVRGLDGGADDYVCKPFGIVELISRIRAVLRRSGRQSTETNLYTYGPVSLDQEKHIVTVDGKPCHLTVKEFELLRYLLVNTDIVLKREQIMEAVWGFTYEAKAGPSICTSRACARNWATAARLSILCAAWAMSSEGTYEAESLPQPADHGAGLYGRDPAHFDVVLLEFHAAPDTAGTGHGHGRRRETIEEGKDTSLYLKKLGVHETDGLRITWINTDGDVLFESDYDKGVMENHLARPEVQAAIENGKGTAVRDSQTVSKALYYYAKKLPDGRFCGSVWNGILFTPISSASCPGRCCSWACRPWPASRCRAC